MTYQVLDISDRLPRHETAPIPYLTQDDVVNVMVHHSGAENDIFTDVRWQVKGRGWWGSSYYMSIDYDGTRYICRKRTQKGWHCGGGGMNHSALPICLRGNGDNHPFTPEQLESLHEALIGENEHYGRRLNIKWHGDYVDTSCPGKYMPKQDIEAAIEAHYNPPAAPEPEDPVQEEPQPEEEPEPEPPPPSPKVPDTPVGCGPTVAVLILASLLTMYLL